MKNGSHKNETDVRWPGRPLEYCLGLPAINISGLSFKENAKFLENNCRKTAWQVLEGLWGC